MRKRRGQELLNPAETRPVVAMDGMEHRSEIRAARVQPLRFLYLQGRLAVSERTEEERRSEVLLEQTEGPEWITGQIRRRLPSCRTELVGQVKLVAALCRNI